MTSALARSMRHQPPVSPVGLLAREREAALATAWALPPRFAKGEVFGPWAPERAAETAARQWLHQRRHAVAALLLMALGQGWVTEQDLNRAFEDTWGATGIVRLLAEALRRACQLVNETAQRVAGLSEDEVGPDRWRNPFSASIDPCHPDERRCLQGHAAPHDSLVLTGDALADHCFESLHGVSEPLARTVFRVLDLLREGALALDAHELAQSGYLSQDHLDLHHDLVAEGIADDPDAMVAFLRQDPQFQGMWGIVDREEILAFCEDAEALSAPPPPWQTPTAGTSVRQVAEETLRTVWGWRRQAPELHRHPWSRFSAYAAGALRRFARHAPAENWRSLPWCGLVDEEASLELLSVISYGESYLDDLLENARECLCQSGETPMARWELHPGNHQDVLGRLEWLGLSFGLLLRADHVEEEVRRGG